MGTFFCNRIPVYHRSSLLQRKLLDVVNRARHLCCIIYLHVLAPCTQTKSNFDKFFGFEYTYRCSNWYEEKDILRIKVKAKEGSEGFDRSKKKTRKQMVHSTCRFDRKKGKIYSWRYRVFFFCALNVSRNVVVFDETTIHWGIVKYYFVYRQDFWIDRIESRDTNISFSEISIIVLVMLLHINLSNRCGYTSWNTIAFCEVVKTVWRECFCFEGCRNSWQFTSLMYEK